MRSKIQYITRHFFALFMICYINTASTGVLMDLQDVSEGQGFNSLRGKSLVRVASSMASKEPSLILEDSALAIFGRALGVDFYMPASVMPKQADCWLAKLSFSSQDRNIIHKRIMPAYTANQESNPTNLYIVFYGEQPVFLLSEGLTWDQLPARVQEENMKQKCRSNI